MAVLKGNIRRALVEDLATINTVVAGAVMAWPMAERVKRLALTTLLYDNIDMANLEFLVFEEAGNLLGVAAWDPAGFTLAGDDASRGALFHGLYVRPDAQGRGIGRDLIAAVAQRARRCHKDGLLIKAERVSVSYFERLGMPRMAPGQASGYPHQFWLPVSDPAALSLRI